MKSQLALHVSRMLDALQVAAANLDPDVLQWPAGTAIALLLWLCALVRLQRGARVTEWTFKGHK